MSKYMRKDFFAMTVDDLERILGRLLENMRLGEIKIQGATRSATAVANERLRMGEQAFGMRIEISIAWSEQSDGVTVIVTVHEPQIQQEWVGCLCNRLADSLIGALRTVFEMEHGVDA